MNQNGLLGIIVILVSSNAVPADKAPCGDHCGVRISDGLVGHSCALASSVVTQVSNQQTPSDARSNQFEDPKGTSWRVLSVDSYAGGPLAIIEVEEVRQQNPPSTWGVYVQNRSSAPVTSFTLAAAIVTGAGDVKAIQPLPAIKNLKPNQVVRREMRVTVAVLMPTDRVVFFIKEVSGSSADWKAADADIGALIKSAARRLPVQ